MNIFETSKTTKYKLFSYINLFLRGITRRLVFVYSFVGLNKHCTKEFFFCEFDVNLILVEWLVQLSLSLLDVRSSPLALFYLSFLKDTVCLHERN